MSSASRSVALPFPSSPHWVPTMTLQASVLLLPLETETYTDVGQVLHDLVVVDAGGGLEHIESLDPAQGPSGFGQRLLRGVVPGLGRNPDQVDRFDDGHDRVISLQAPKSAAVWCVAMCSIAHQPLTTEHRVRARMVTAVG